MNFSTQTPYEARKREGVPKLMEHRPAFAKLSCSSWAGSSRLHTAWGCALPQLLLCLQSSLGHRIQHCETSNKLLGTLPVLFHYKDRHLPTETFLLFRTSSSWVYLTFTSLTWASFLSRSHAHRFHDSGWHIILPLHLQSPILLEHVSSQHIYLDFPRQSLELCPSDTTTPPGQLIAAMMSCQDEMSMD